MQKITQWITQLLWWLVVSVVILLATFVVITKQAMPYVDNYRTQIESNLSQIVGYPVQLGLITAKLDGLDPTFIVKGIELQTPAASSVVVEQFSVRIDLIQSLLSASPQFTYIRFTKPSIAIKETQGQWHLVGTAPDDNKQTVGYQRIMNYLLAQRQITLLDGKVSIESERFGSVSLKAPTVYLQKNQQQGIGAIVDLFVEEYETPLKLEVEINPAANGDIALNAHITAINLHWPMQTVAPNSTIPLEAITGSFDVWVDYQLNKKLQIKGSLFADKIALKGQSGLEVESQFSAKYDFTSQLGRLDLVQLTLKDTLTDRLYTPIMASFSVDLSREDGQFSGAFDQLDSSLLSNVAEGFLPEDSFASRLLTQMNLQGTISNASLRFPLNNPSDFTFLSNLQNVSGDGFDGIPKVSNLNGLLKLSESDGYIEFTSANGELGFPDLYDAPWQTAKTSGLVEWRRQQDIFLVKADNLHIERNGAVIDGGFRLEVLQDSPNWLFLDIQASNIPIRDRLDYIPDNVLGEAAIDWVQSALSGGHITDLGLVLQTQLEKGAKPHVRLNMDLDDTSVDFASDWPEAKKVKAQFKLDEQGIDILVDSASLADLWVEGISITLPFANGKVNWLTVEGGIEDELNDILSLLRSTNLSDSALKPFKSWTASGNARGAFSISIPMQQALGDPIASLDLFFDKNRLNIEDLDIVVDAVSGELHFHSKKGITDSSFKVNVFGGESQLQISSKQFVDLPMAIFVEMSGSAKAYQLSNWQQAPVMISNNVVGNIDYKGLLSINEETLGKVSLKLDSSLEGIELLFPKPLSKDSDTIEKMQFEMDLLDDNLHLQFQYKDTYFADLLFHKSQLTSGHILVGDHKNNLSLDTQKGIHIKGQLEALDVDEWVSFLGKYSDAPSSTEAAAEITIPNWLQTMDIIVDKLQVNRENELHNFKIEYSQLIDPDTVKVNSDQVNVTLSRDDHGYLVHANYLNWKTSENETITEDQRLAPFKASQVPNMTIILDQLFINDRGYGDWTLKITNEGNRLRVQPISTALKKGQFVGSLFWQDDNERSNVEMTVSIEGGDAAELTGKFSPTPFLTSKNYKIDINLSWLGHPFNFDRESVSGRISFDAKNGKFTQVDELPPFLRALGIFNINALTRRLSLDFSDVYEPGLSYDTFNGVLTLQQGIVDTSTPIEIISPTAEVILNGKANLIDRTLDERLTASFPLGNSLPIAGFLLGAPQLAGLLYVTDKLIGNQLSKVTSVQYRISGPFANPDVKAVQYQPIKR